MTTKLLRYPSVVAEKPGVAACLGNFDGVHLGHEYLLGKLILSAKERNLRSMLISFYPHPALVLGKAKDLPRITNVSEVYRIVNDLGLDFLYYIHFTKGLSELSAGEFINNILFKDLNVQHLLVGEDARVGKGGEGDAAFILNQFRQAGRSVETQKFIDFEGGRVSSRLVRDRIREGDVEKVHSLLNRDFVLEGRVVPGNKLGRTLGFPTANLSVNKNKILPKIGVYATKCSLSGKDYCSVTNIGFRPTVAGSSEKKATVESYLIGYTGKDFYREKLKLRFVKRLRDEIKFPSIEDLKSQINKDISEAKKVLNE